ncbi:MAG: zinc ribbon domain-containing protein, partial [Elusimicrobia bacterium]|nr:zinc ribbon domain-containing protein [Elusimicrobiota bacterium]
FKRQLKYKAKWNSKYFIEIDRFAPTSKTCSNCGNIQDMPLNKRQFDCSDCGVSLDRDLNAGINICRLGQSQINARGVEGLPSTLKQEKESLVN